MLIKVSVSPKRVKGYESLQELNGCFFNGATSHIIHMAYNLHSVSFAVLMVPSARQQWWGDGNACILKIRCDYANVHYVSYGYCLPVVNEIIIDEWQESVVVSIKDYADITCDRIVAKVERIPLTSHDLPIFSYIV